MTEQSDLPKPQNPGLLAKLGMAFLIVFATWNSFMFSLVVPIGGAPDEVAHLDHVQFIYHEKRMPDPSRDRCGQIQHPSFPYMLDALLLGMFRKIGSDFDDADLAAEKWQDVLWQRTTFRPGDSWTQQGIKASENDAGDLPHRKALLDSLFWQYYALRWVSLLLGISTAIALLFGLRYAFPEHVNVAWAACGALFLLPGWAAHFGAVSNDPWLTMTSAWACAFALKFRHEQRLLKTASLIKLGLMLGLDGKDSEVGQEEGLRCGDTMSRQDAAERIR